MKLPTGLNYLIIFDLVSSKTGSYVCPADNIKIYELAFLLNSFNVN